VAPIDYLIIFAYLAGMVIIGAFFSKQIETHEDEVVAGKSLSSLSAGIARAANVAGGSTSVGGTGYGYSMGVTGSWFGISSAMGNWIMVPFARRIKNILDRGNFLTIGDFLGYRYGEAARIISGGLNTIAYAGFVSSQIVATGTIMHVLLGWDLKTGMIVTTAIVIVYTIMGGLKAVVYTDYVQIVIIYLGMVFLLLPKSLNQVGGFSELVARVPEGFLKFGAMGTLSIVGMLVATGLAFFCCQATYGYLAASKNPTVAVRSSILCGVFYIIPAMAVIVIGMACVVLYPDLGSSQDALPTIIVNLLPVGVVGILFSAIIAATMSTSDTCLLMSTMCYVQDIYKGFINKEADDKQMLKVTRLSMIVLGVLALLIAMYYPNIIGLILWGYSFAVGGLLASVVMALYWKRTTNTGALASMFVGGGVHLYLTVTGFYIPAVLISAPLGFIVIVVVSLLTPKPDVEKYRIYFDDEYQKSIN